jgi:crotonobetainyl-CoA:carnitine CoA-transferase CaiB-like acyl-CoA transferase
VFDLTSGIVGPYTTKLLADLGARVIKVERPEGDPSRLMGPWFNDEQGIENSGTYQFLNTNKQSIVIDLSKKKSQLVIADLVGLADLVVTSFSPPNAEKYKLRPSDIRELADVNILSITNFGWTGPYRDFKLSETVLYAMGGEMYSHGIAGQPPLKLGGVAALLQCGAMGAIGALGAIHAKELHNITQDVGISLFDVQINSVDRRSSTILAFRFSGRMQERPEVGGLYLIGGVYACADGFVEVTGGVSSSHPYWSRVTDMIGDPRLKEAKWGDLDFVRKPEAKSEADAIVVPWMIERTREEIWSAARDARVILAPLFTGKDLANDKVFKERGLWVEVEHDLLGKFPMLGRPYIFEKTPWGIRRPAPMLGEDTDKILGECGYDSAQIKDLRLEEVVR